MEFVKVELEVGKESKEVVDALSELIKDIRAKKDVSTIATENLASLLKAVEGIDDLDDEFKSKAQEEIIAYCAIKIAEAIREELPQV